jgi:hypothetical protein
MPIFTIHEYHWDLVRFTHEIDAASIGEAVSMMSDNHEEAIQEFTGVDVRDSIQVELDGVDHNDQPHVQFLDYTEREAVFHRKGWYGVREASDA